MKVYVLLTILALAIAGCVSSNDTYNEYADGVVFTADWQTYEELLRKQQFYFIEYIEGEQIIVSPGYKNQASCEFALQRSFTDDKVIVCGRLK